ncbi:IcmT/TraK family protein (plasmid) [Roseomonas mucosa]|uniref:IcmT/TraK family protein n=1 Tax=Roseomonas mucosa TaxID=207340 RepID=UPI0030CE91D2
MWRNTALPIRFLMLDARALLPVLCFVVYWSWTTLYIALIGSAFFGILSFFGLTLPALSRIVRCWLVGRIRPAVPAWKRRRLA